MKKIAIILACTLLALSLIACGEKKGKTYETTSFKEVETEPPTKVMNEDGGYTEYEYNEKGQMIKSHTYSVDGELIGYTEAVFENGSLTKRIWYSGEGEIIREISLD